MSDLNGSSNVHFSSKSDDWGTPPDFFKALDKEFGFTLDPCASDSNAKCSRYFTREDNGLLKSWADEIVFMNPPYGREIPHWMKKAHDSSRNEAATVVCLVPSRTDTRWWHDFAMKHEVRFIRGRLYFGDGSERAPFPSAVIVMRPREFQIASL